MNSNKKKITKHRIPKRDSNKPRAKKVSFRKNHKVFKIPNEHYKTPRSPIKI